jgi:septal ring factor EnvC (AmiA/AmiB activator)
MNQSTQTPEAMPEPTSGTAAAAAAGLVNPNLSAEIREDCGAIQSDLQEAENLAAIFETQMAAKSKEILHLRRLVDQTRSHLYRLQEGIAAMRKERHKLANEAMCAQGLTLQLSKVTAERDRLKAELDGVLQALVDENAGKSALKFDKRDVQVVELTVQVVNLKRELEEIRKYPYRFIESLENGRAPKTAARESAVENDSVEIQR